MEVDLAQVDLSLYMELAITWGMRLLSAIAILVVGWIAGNWTKKRIFNITKLDKTISSFLGALVKYSILAVALVAVLGQFGIQTASLLAVLGAAGLAIGLALQGTLSNVAAGVMMLILRPFKVGDYIESGSIGGTVVSLGLFGVELDTVDNKYVYAPNSNIWSSEIVNYSKYKQRRQDLIVGISYDDDINKTIDVLHDVLANDKRVITTKDKEAFIKVINMGDFSVDLMIRLWTKTDDYFHVQWDLKKDIKEALDKNGITIPFPTQLEIVQEAKA